MSTKNEWKLADLAEEAGVPPRTVRYYVQRGLLPAPAFRGPETAYGREHLLRLKAIKRLQAKYLPLDEIQRELERLDPGALEALAERGEWGGSGAGGPSGAPAPRAPAPPAPPAPEVDGPTYRRVELAPGLELHVGAFADEKTRRLAERLIEVARREGGRG